MKKILSNLKELLTKRLLAQTKIGKGKPVYLVESADILDFKINNDEEVHDKIIVSDFHAFARINIEFIENSF